MITPGHWANMILKFSHLPWEYTALCCYNQHYIGFNQTQIPSLPSQAPIYTPWWTKAW